MYFPPLDIPLSLSANFGELRPNHFHMGIDYRTNGREGLNIHAIEDGFVSRVKISPFGYGKVVYIDHPNGITSVYAHCSKFLGKLDSIVSLQQIKEQNFEIDFKPDSNLIPIKKGEIFALTGNTGNSSGPHLHFELRDTKTELALNPLVNGFDVYDTIPPTIQGIKIYALNKDVYRWPNKSKIANVVRNKNLYSILNNKLTLTSDYCSDGGIGFSLEAEDHINGYTHDFSYFGSILLVNNDTVFIHENDEISFDGSKFINTHEDMDEYRKSKRKFQKSFKTNENYLESYSTSKKGIIPIQPKDSLHVQYFVYDTHNNQSELSFDLKVLPGNPNKNVFNITNCILPNSKFTYQDSLSTIEIPEGCVYEPVSTNFQAKTNITIGSNGTAIQLPIQVKLKIRNSELPLEKYFIKVGGNNKYLETTYEDGWLIAQSKYLGTFSIDIDTIAPVFVASNFNQNDSIIKKSILTWKISEEKTQLKDYDLFIDNEWQLLEYESKGSYLYFNKPKDLKGLHKIKLIVKDACENARIWEKDIWFE